MNRILLLTLLACSCFPKVDAPCGSTGCEPEPIVTDQGGSAGGEPSPDGGATDAGAPDAGTPDAGRMPAGCDALRRAADHRAEVAQLASSFRGATLPTVQEVADEVVMLSGLAIPVAAPTGDAVVAALAQLPGSPFRALALTGNVRTTGLDDTRTAWVLRTAPAPNTPWFAEPAVTMTLLLRDGQWRIASAILSRSVIFATPDHVAQLTACSSNETAAPNRAFTFEGMTFVNNCTPSGTYRYTSRPSDEVRWAWGFGKPDGVAWHWRAGRWQLLRPARLTVNPANYWPRVQEADAMCGGVVGWELMFDVITGELVESRPGINCVTC